jgi:hypothetical protein
MSTVPPPPASDPAGRRVTLASGSSRTLLLALLAIAVFSVPVFCTRFLNDMAYYALVAGKLLRGGLLYRNAMDTKPPLIFLHYAAIFRVFGTNNVTAVKLVTMAWLALSALAMWGIRRELFPSSPRPELAALVFVLASFSGWGEDFLSSNTEILANLFVVLGVLSLVSDDFSDRASRIALGGGLVGIAFLYRYQAGGALAAYCITVVLMREPPARMIHRFFFLALGSLVPIGLLVAYYGWIGALPDLAALLRYQSYYIRAHDLYWPQFLGQTAIAVLSQAPFLVLAGSQTAAMMRRRRLDRREVFLLSFLGFSVCSFLAAGHFFAHYFVQAIPAVVLLATERLVRSDGIAPSVGLGPRLRSFFFRHARGFALANAVMFTIINTAYYSLHRGDRPSPALARFVRGHTTPDDPVFIWTRWHLFFEIDRVFATRFLSNEFLTGQLYGTRHRQSAATAETARNAAVPEVWSMLLSDLEIERPPVIVDDVPGPSNFTIDHYPALFAFVREHYEPPRVMDGLCVYLRKDEGRRR